MIITLKKETPQQEIDNIIAQLEANGFKVVDMVKDDIHLLGILGETSFLEEQNIGANNWVAAVTRITAPYKKASREFHPQDTIVSVDGIKIGGREKIVIIGGPCSVENKEQIMTIAEAVALAGAKMLRGGAYKYRTSPYAFQGLESEGITYLVEAKKKYKLPIVSEITTVDKIEEFVANVDVIQVGARNMQNIELLKALGKTNKPIILKRGLSSTVEEWLMSAEYILAEGNSQVILCERGIRTFEKATRNTLDLSVIPLIKKLSHLPIIVDPSHATGHWELVESMSLAAIAAGADGLLIEVHHNPLNALSDGQQSLKLKNFATLIENGRKIARVIGRDI
ncbi:MAG TPA: 3-deoxy-7-phosphoheptulonate synthase [Bacilli bacterium]|nr:3-deoxy-7-phosphoheptulonate synthase [Bacilli bacterium]